MDSFSQKVPNGKYKVNLYFAETFDEVTEPGAASFPSKSATRNSKISTWSRKPAPRRRPTSNPSISTSPTAW